MSQLDVLKDFENYEDYIKHQITPLDLFYIEDEELIFEIFSCGLKSRGILSEEEFKSIFPSQNKREKAYVKDKVEENQETNIYSIEDLFNETSDFFRAMLSHIHYCKEKKIGSILFIRYINKNNSEISSYIDINCNNIFSKIKRKKYIYATKKDLSYFNWKTNYVSTNHSENYQIIYNKRIGIIFLHIKSRTYLVLHKELMKSTGIYDNLVSSVSNNAQRDHLKDPKKEKKKSTYCKKNYTFMSSDNIYKTDENKKNFELSNGKVTTLCEDVRKVIIHDSNYLQCLLYSFPIN